MASVKGLYNRSPNKACFYCGHPVYLTRGQNSPFQATKDHVVPRSKGGRELVLSCNQCNRDKAHLTLEEYRLLAAGRRGLVAISPDTFKFFGEFQKDCSMIRA